MPIQTTQIAAPAVRQGVFTSPTFSIPAGILNLKLSANLLLADKLAVGLTFDLDVQHSPDSGATWRSACGFGWTSYGPGGIPNGIGGSTTPDPYVAFAPIAFLGQPFRLVATVAQPLSIGLTVDITT
jgi:hypothetical protein